MDPQIITSGRVGLFFFFGEFLLSRKTNISFFLTYPLALTLSSSERHSRLDSQDKREPARWDGAFIMGFSSVGSIGDILERRVDLSLPWAPKDTQSVRLAPQMGAPISKTMHWRQQWSWEREGNPRLLLGGPPTAHPLLHTGRLPVPLLAIQEGSLPYSFPF